MSSCPPINSRSRLTAQDFTHQERYTISDLLPDFWLHRPTVAGHANCCSWAAVIGGIMRSQGVKPYTKIQSKPWKSAIRSHAEIFKSNAPSGAELAL